jgi:hypothetical protein
VKDITRKEVIFMAFAEAPVADYELCEACEKSMQDAGVMGHTTQQMFDMGAEFYFDLAFILMGEGHLLVRKSELGKQYPKIVGIVETKDSCEDKPHYEIAAINPDTDKVEAYVTLTNQDILASDWTIAKLKEEQDHSEFEVDLSESQGE